MRSALATLVLVAMATAMTTAVQQGIGSPVSRPLIVAELSDLLVHSPLAACSSSATPPIRTRARVASWNIKAARSAPVDALAAEMRAMQADVIALQEVDVRARRSGFVDEPTALASALGYHYVFAASILWDEGHYGLALVSRWPLVQVARHRIAGADLGEPRIVLDVTMCVDGRPLRVLNHHADRRPAARALGFVDVQAIARTTAGSSVLLVGDMNEWAEGPGVRAVLDTGLVDLGAAEGLDTSNSGRIDYLFTDVATSRHASPARVWPTDKSDHHAVFTDLEW